jgi:hypothetical protein
MAGNYYLLWDSDKLVAKIGPPASGAGDATSIQGTPVDTTAPTDGQALFFDVGLGKYTPKTPAVSTPKVYTCPSGATVRQAVYLASSNTVALANAGNTSKAPCFGLIASKPTSTTCTIQRTGPLAGFSALTPGDKMFLDETDGQIVNAAPTSSNRVVQQVGIAVAADTVELLVDPAVYTLRA